MPDANPNIDFFNPQSSQIEVCFFQNLESTHSFAINASWEHRMEKNKLIVIFADKQTHGYGAHNQIWYSPHTDFHINLIFLADKMLPFSQLAAITACQHLKKITGNMFNFQLKWPNDIFIDGKKIGGCLTYIRPWDKGFWITIGIGLNYNLKKEDFKQIPQLATSLNVLLDKKSPYSLQEIHEDIQAFSDFFIRNLHWYNRIGADRFFKSCQEIWLYLNYNVVIFDEDKHVWVEGIFEGITEEGFLILTPMDTYESFHIINGTKLQLAPKQPENYKDFIDNLL